MTVTTIHILKIFTIITIISRTGPAAHTMVTMKIIMDIQRTAVQEMKTQNPEEIQHTGHTIPAVHQRKHQTAEADQEPHIITVPETAAVLQTVTEETALKDHIQKIIINHTETRNQRSKTKLREVKKLSRKSEHAQMRWPFLSWNHLLQQLKSNEPI